MCLFQQEYSLQINESPIEDDDSTSNVDDTADFSSSLYEVNFSRPESSASSEKEQKPKLRTSIQEDPPLEKPFKIFKEGTSTSAGSDVCSTFAKYIAEKLRTYNCRTRAIVQHEINNILFRADMGKFEVYSALDPLSHPSEETSFN